MFAGPNGSGKSTIRGVLPYHLLGTYINADDIERTLHQSKRLALAGYGLCCTDGLLKDIVESPLFARAARTQFDMKCDGDYLVVDGAMNPYLPATLADLARLALLSQRESFSFETVMSAPQKVELLQRAQDAGYRTYLYFVTTEDPE